MSILEHVEEDWSKINEHKNHLLLALNICKKSQGLKLSSIAQHFRAIMYSEHMYMSIKSIFKCVVRTSDYKKYEKELRKAMPDDKVSIKPFEKVSLTKYDYVEKKKTSPSTEIFECTRSTSMELFLRNEKF